MRNCFAFADQFKLAEYLKSLSVEGYIDKTRTELQAIVRKELKLEPSIYTIGSTSKALGLIIKGSRRLDNAQDQELLNRVKRIEKFLATYYSEWAELT